MNTKPISNKFILKNRPKYDHDKILMGVSCLHLDEDGMLRCIVDPYAGYKRIMKYTFICIGISFFIYTFFYFSYLDG